MFHACVQRFNVMDGNFLDRELNRAKYGWIFEEASWPNFSANTVPAPTKNG
jgi:hypothetical protein